MEDVQNSRGSLAAWQMLLYIFDVGECHRTTFFNEMARKKHRCVILQKNMCMDDTVARMFSTVVCCVIQSPSAQINQSFHGTVSDFAKNCTKCAFIGSRKYPQVYKNSIGLKIGALQRFQLLYGCHTMVDSFCV